MLRAMPRPESSSRAVQRYMRARLLAKQARAARDELPPASATTQAIDPIGPSQRVSEARRSEAIDLLNDQPAEVVDVERLNWALSFGFAGGDIGGLLVQAMHGHDRKHLLDGPGIGQGLEQGEVAEIPVRHLRPDPRDQPAQLLFLQFPGQPFQYAPVQFITPGAIIQRTVTEGKQLVQIITQ